MIQLWCEVYDASYTSRVADSDLLLRTARVEKVLDGPGRVSIETPVLHIDYTSRALSVLQTKRVVEIYYRESEHATKRLVTSFVIDKVRWHQEQGGVTFTVNGADTLILLENTSTSLGLTYDNQNIYTVMQDLMPSGWSSYTSGIVGTMSARFDGTSILKAIQRVVQETGYHFILQSKKQVRFFNVSSPIPTSYRIVKLEGDKPMPARGSNIIPLETIDIDEDSSEVVNKIIPLYAGDGDSRGDLSESNRSSPYTIQTETGPDGRTIYYLSDSDSVTAYGTIEKVLNFSKIAPIGISSTVLQRTANQLYDAAREWLDRHKDPLTTLTVRVFQQRVDIDPGDQVAVEYIERVNIAGTPVTLKSIDGDYFVMAVTETFGESGEGARLELSDIDRTPTQNGDILVESVDRVEVQETGYKPTYNIWSKGPYDMVLGADQTLYLTIPDDVLLVTNVTMFLDTSENSTTVTPVDAGYVYVRLGAFGGTTGQYPEFDVTVNSTLVGDDLGDSASALSTYSIDITDEIVGAGNGGRGTHDILFELVSGQGPVRVQFEIRGLIVQGRV